MKNVQNTSIRQTHITLLRGPIVSTVNSLNNPAVPSISLAYLSAYLKADGFQVSWVDAICNGLDTYWPLKDYPGYQCMGLTFDEIISAIPAHTNVIGINAMFSGEWPVTRDLLKRVKHALPDTIIVAGGEHITALTEFSLRDCPAIDYCIQGEGEKSMADLLHTIETGGSISDIAGVAFIDETGAFQTGLNPVRIREIDSIPWPDWPVGYLETFWSAGKSAGAGFGRDMPMMLSRGCPYQCTFCSNPEMWTTRYIIRGVDDVISEIKQHIEDYKISSIQLYDLTAITKKKWLVEFCSTLLKENIQLKWSVPQGTRSETLDEEALLLLKQTGCHYLVYAPESGSPKTLAKIKKRIVLKNLVKSVLTARKIGIVVRINLIIGFPDETRFDVLRTILFSLHMAARGIDEVSVNLFSPYPGSELFNDLHGSGKIQLNDTYFLNLTSLNSEYTSLNPWTVNQHMGSRELAICRLLLLMANYIVGYIFYPSRIIRSWRNIRSNNEAATVFEQRLKDFLNNRIKIKRSSV